MANLHAYWILKINETEDDSTKILELTDEDRNHIAHMIQEGYYEGEITKDEENE